MINHSTKEELKAMAISEKIRAERMKNTTFIIEIVNFGDIKVKVYKEDDRIKTWATAYHPNPHLSEHGLLDESTGKFFENGNDITTNYMTVAAQTALKHLGYKIKIDPTYPCDRKIKIRYHWEVKE